MAIVLQQVWFQVKAVNPQLSVCQLGAMIGRMWRELSEEDKRRHLDDFHQDKVSFVSGHPPKFLFWFS
jgi:HMG (high mobility group) box